MAAILGEKMDGSRAWHSFSRLKRRFFELINGIATCIALGACASTASNDSNLESLQPVSATVQPVAASFDDKTPRGRPTRGSAVVESGIAQIGKNLIIDPLVRPYSTLKALYGTAFKSGSGFAERAFIARFRMPQLERTPIPPVSDAEPMDLEAWERELDALLKTEASSGSIRYLVDGEAYFSRLNEAIDDARKSIHIRSYIYDNDDVALELADRLRDRADQVEVNILVDGLADLFATRLDSVSMPADVQLPPSISEYLTYDTRVKLRKQSNPWFTGDHVKITLIDEELAFVGGMNIGREYRYDWHDLMMEIEGPIVGQLQYEFDQAWARAGYLGDFGWLLHALKNDRSEIDGTGYPIRMLTTTIHDSELYRAQIAAIRRSRRYIYIENAYFSDDKILFELAQARRRGVDVRVIIGSSNDSGILNLSNQATANVMLRNGIRVYVYPGMTHVKAAVYDGWACLGSANFDKLSLQINQEVNLGTSHPAAVEDLLASVFYPDFAKSRELSAPFRLQARHHLAEFVADEFF